MAIIGTDYSRMTREALTQSMREKLKNAVGSKCEKCNTELPTGVLEVHHIKEVYTAKGKFDLNSPSNIIILCKNCHGLVHQKLISEPELRDIVYERIESVRQKINAILIDRTKIIYDSGEIEILEPNLSDKNAFYHLGNKFYSQKLFDNAIIEYNKAIQIDPHFAEAHFNLSLALKKKGLMIDAIRELGEAIKINPYLSGSEYQSDNPLS